MTGKSPELEFRLLGIFPENIPGKVGFQYHEIVNIEDGAALRHNRYSVRWISGGVDINLPF